MSEEVGMMCDIDDADHEVDVEVLVDGGAFAVCSGGWSSELLADAEVAFTVAMIHQRDVDDATARNADTEDEEWQ
ncbi:hypothetical protein [Actinokineospora sp. NPDC004072]